MTERSQQYETNVKVETLQQTGFKKGDNPAACGKYFTTSYIPRASDAAVLSKNLDQLTSLKTEVNKLKNEVIAMDQGLFDKSGRRLSPGKSIHHDFNSATVNKLNELARSKRFSIYGSGWWKAKGVTEHIQGLGRQAIYLQRSKEEAKQKERYQTKGSQDGECKNKSQLQKVLPRVNHDNIDVTIGVEDIFIAALVSLSRKVAKVLHETLKSDNRFSEAAKAYISDSLPPSLALSDSESLSDSDTDQWQTWNCDIILITSLCYQTSL